MGSQRIQFICFYTFKRSWRYRGPNGASFIPWLAFVYFTHFVFLVFYSFNFLWFHVFSTWLHLWLFLKSCKETNLRKSVEDFSCSRRFSTAANLLSLIFILGWLMSGGFAAGNLIAVSSPSSCTCQSPPRPPTSGGGRSLSFSKMPQRRSNYESKQRRESGPGERWFHYGMQELWLQRNDVTRLMLVGKDVLSGGGGTCVLLVLLGGRRKLERLHHRSGQEADGRAAERRQKKSNL